MKHFAKQMLAVGALAVMGCLPVCAQNKNVFKANLLSPLVRTGSFFFERLVTERSSLQLGVAYTGFTAGDVSMRGLQILPEYRFYFSDKEGPEGFYLAPFARYRNFSIKDKNGSGTEGKVQGFGGGLCAGYQFLFGSSNRVALDLFLGPSFGSTKVSGTDASGETYDTPTGLSGFGLRSGLAIGIAF